MKDYFSGLLRDLRKCETKKDFFVDGIKCELKGVVDFTAKFVQKHQLLKTRLWDLFVNQFVLRVDGNDGGWRGKTCRAYGWIMEIARRARPKSKNRTFLSSANGTSG